MVISDLIETRGRHNASPFFLFSKVFVVFLVLAATLLPYLAGCVTPIIIAGNASEIDARVRGDLFIPDSAPTPKIVVADAARLSTLNSDVRAVMATSGGAVYDPNTQTIYLDANRYQDRMLHHELVHHYSRYMTESQRIECLARLYEIHASHQASFAGCPP